jgi:hypothetical protein
MSCMRIFTSPPFFFGLLYSNKQSLISNLCRVIFTEIQDYSRFILTSMTINPLPPLFTLATVALSHLTEMECGNLETIFSR